MIAFWHLRHVKILTQNWCILFESASSSKRPTTETLMRALNHVIFEKNEFQHPSQSALISVSGMLVSRNGVFQHKHFRMCFVSFGSWGNRMVNETHQKLENSSIIQIYNQLFWERFINLFGCFWKMSSRPSRN